MLRGSRASGNRYGSSSRLRSSRTARRWANGRFVKVVLNGQVIHENLEVTDVTPGGLTGKEVPAGPLMFQGDHGPVAYRNIRVTVPRGQ